MKKLFILSLLIVVGIIAAGQTVYADSATLSVLPASSTKNVGTAFNVSVQINPAGNQVCVVKGVINFNNLTCQSITLANGLMAQTIPTCASPNFTVGIPKCATTVQNIFSASVKGTLADQASLSLSGIKVIGAGADVAFTLQSGAYNITAIQAGSGTTPTTTPKTTPKTTPATQPAQPKQPTQPIISTQPEEPNGYPETTTQPAGFLASLATAVNALLASLLSAGAWLVSKIVSNIFWIIILVIITILAYIFGRRSHKKPENTPQN